MGREDYSVVKKCLSELNLINEKKNCIFILQNNPEIIQKCFSLIKGQLSEAAL
jgi:hypothetical protein